MEILGNVSLTSGFVGGLNFGSSPLFIFFILVILFESIPILYPLDILITMNSSFEYSYLGRMFPEYSVVFVTIFIKSPILIPASFNIFNGLFL